MEQEQEEEESGGSAEQRGGDGGDTDEARRSELGSRATNAGFFQAAGSREPARERPSTTAAAAACREGS